MTYSSASPTKCIQRCWSILLIVVFSLSFGFSAKAFEPIIYDIHRTTTQDELAESFAQWITRSEFEDMDSAIPYFSSLQIDLPALFKRLGISSNQEGYSKFRSEMRFFKELDPKSKSIVTEFVANSLSSVRSAWGSVVLTNNQHFWVECTSNPLQFIVRSQKLESISGKSIISFEPLQSVRTMGGDFVKINGKAKLVRGSNEAAWQLFIRNDSSEVNFHVTSGKVKKRLVKLDPIVRLKPLIRLFSADRNRIEEGHQAALTWQVLGASKVTLSNGIGEKPTTWQLVVAPEQDAVYELTAQNEAGTSVLSVSISVDRIYLNYAAMVFLQNKPGNDKKKETIVVVELINKFGETVSTLRCGADKEFKVDGELYGPFEFELNQPILKKDLQSGLYTIRTENSSEEDLWTFTPIIILKYSNGSESEFYAFGGRSVESNSTGVEVPF